MRLLARSVALLTLMALSCAPSPAATAPLTGLGFYKDVTQGLDPARPLLRSVAGDTLPGALPATAAPLVWAFAGGACGQERWGTVAGADFAAANVPAFAQAGRPYWVSTGGAEDQFHCEDAAGMAAFIARYDSPLLQGLDFDIEGRQSPAQIDALVREAAAAARQHPRLRFMFTLATLAGSDGAGAGLNATGEQVMAALRRHHFDSALVNLMVMDYGPARAAACVLRPAGDCDMGRSALQAARNLQARHGWPLAQTAVTAMLGVNDVTENVFSLADARQLLADARAAGLAGAWAWSLDRDAPCPAGVQAVSPRCHGLPGLAPGDFAAQR